MQFTHRQVGRHFHQGLHHHLCRSAAVEAWRVHQNRLEALAIAAAPGSAGHVAGSCPDAHPAKFEHRSLGQMRCRRDHRVILAGVCNGQKLRFRTKLRLVEEMQLALGKLSLIAQQAVMEHPAFASICLRTAL